MQELEGLRVVALAFANELRVIAGHDPVDALEPGSLLDCVDCPLARTAGGGAVGHGQAWRGGWVIAGTATLYGPRGGVRAAAPIPQGVLDFMAAFDAEQFPELIAAPLAVAA